MIIRGFSIEFKSDKDGHPVLMEINPRIVAIIKIFKEGGLNLLYLKIKRLLDEELLDVRVRYGINSREDMRIKR